MKRIIFLIIFLIAGITVTYYFIKPKQEKNLPVLNPIDLNPEMVDPELLRLGMGHTIGSFSFKNQDGKTITEKDVKGKVFVTEYFFTTCGTICPIMNDQMQRVHKAYMQNKKMDDSIIYLKQMVERDPYFPPAYCEIGDAYESKGDHANAVLWWEKALKTDPENWKVKTCKNKLDSKKNVEQPNESKNTAVTLINSKEKNLDEYYTELGIKR